MLKKILLLLLAVFVVQVYSQRHNRGKGKHHHSGWKGRKIEMPTFDKKQMLKEDSIKGITKMGGLRFAKSFEVNLNMENSGEVISFEDNTKIWQLDIESDEALSLNLIFSKFHLIEGDTLYVYNEELSKVIGPLTDKNNLQSGILPLEPIVGSHLIVEFHQSSEESPLRLLEIGTVNHDYRGFRLLPQSNESSYSKDTCSLNVSCVPEVAQLKQSVCLLVINGSSYCSGTLINNTALDGKPYVLTAAHCFDIGAAGVDYAEGATVAPSIVAFFNYEVPNCDETIRGSQEFAIGGTTMKALAGDLDFALIELSSTPPVDFRPYYAGWNLAVVPSPPFRGVHHPYGKVKVTTLEEQAISNNTYPYDTSLLPNSHWELDEYEVGTTESGASGSGLFDASLRLVGGLTGGTSVCDDPTDDWFFRLNKSWNHYAAPTAQLKAWLDPTASGVTTLGGLNPYGNDSALRFSNFAITDTAEIAYLETPEAGFVAGQNSLSIDEYAERFCLPENAYLHGVYLVTGKGNADQTSTDSVTINVYAGTTAPNPAYFLDDKKVLLNTLQWKPIDDLYYSYKVVLSKNENYIKFDTPIAVGDTFFISYEMPYTNLPADSFAVYTAKPRISGGLESAYTYNGSSWSKMFDITGKRTSLWIDPVIQYDAAAIAVDTSLIDRTSRTVIFPNPARDVVNVMTRSDKKGECRVTLYTPFGQKLSTYTGKVRYTNIPISVRNLPKGLYLLRVGYSDAVETHKLIVE